MGNEQFTRDIISSVSTGMKTAFTCNSIHPVTQRSDADSVHNSTAADRLPLSDPRRGT